MIEFERACGTVAENLQLVREKQDVMASLREGQIREMAHVMAQMTDKGADTEEKRQIWLDVTHALGDPSLHIALSGAYYDCLAQKKGKGKEEKIECLPPRTISYLRNRGSDGAYDCITKEMTDVRAVYVSGNEEALENCYDEYSDACILPYSDPERGIHMGFRSMIARYGLKIAHMVRVETREGTAMDFVLLRREVARPTEDAYLAVTLPIHDPQMLAESLQAAIYFGLVNLDVTKLPEQFSATEGYDLHFKGSAEAIDRYLFYLKLSHPRYDLLGIYQKERETI